MIILIVSNLYSKQQIKTWEAPESLRPSQPGYSRKNNIFIRLGVYILICLAYVGLELEHIQTIQILRPNLMHMLVFFRLYLNNFNKTNKYETNQNIGGFGEPQT